MKKITAKDIAARLEISQSTVSRALNNDPNVGEQTKKLVNKTAAEMGFIQKKEGKLIALILPELSRFFLVDLVSEISDYMKTIEYQLLVLQSHGSLEGEIQCLRMCRRFKVDGILISTSEGLEDANHLLPLMEDGIKIVFLDHVPKNRDGKEKLAKVRINDKHAAYIATKHLTWGNHKNILGVFADEKSYMTIHRKEGFLQALKEDQGNDSENMIIYAKTVSSAQEQIEFAVDKYNVTAVFAITDDLILAAINAKHETQKDFCIVGISNGWLPNFYKDKITYVEHSGAKVGRDAAIFLHQLIEHPTTTKPMTRIVDTFLIQNGSCANISK